MAEAWAHEWIKEERLSLHQDELRKNMSVAKNNMGVNDCGINCDDDRLHQQQSEKKKLEAFIDGLTVVSVALEESKVPKAPESDQGSSIDLHTQKSTVSPPPSSYIDAPSPLSTSPRSSIATINFDDYRHNHSQLKECVTCVGEVCATSMSASNFQHRIRPKEKAIEAMSVDGIDISSYFAKTFHDILPMVGAGRQHDTNHKQQQDQEQEEPSYHTTSTMGWKQHLSFQGMRSLLEMTSREMGMAYAGVAKDMDCNNGELLKASTRLEQKHKEQQLVVVDSLIVLCSCPDSMKQHLSSVSKQTIDWEIEPPTAAANLGEGDGAYLRVSRQIRTKVYRFLDELKSCAFIAGEA